MNPSQTQCQDQITIQFNGQISINRESLKMLLVELRPENPPVFQPPPPTPPQKNLPEKAENNKRLVYTMQETADILGVHYITVHRLIQRGLLKCSKALRKKLIPATEIERFLKETL